MCVCACVYVCLCVCVRARARGCVRVGVETAPFVSEPYQTLALALEEKGDKERAFQVSFYLVSVEL